jgi:hypothetical protein
MRLRRRRRTRSVGNANAATQASTVSSIGTGTGEKLAAAATIATASTLCVARRPTVRFMPDCRMIRSSVCTRGMRIISASMGFDPLSCAASDGQPLPLHLGTGRQRLNALFDAACSRAAHLAADEAGFDAMAGSVIKTVRDRPAFLRA